MKYFLLQKNNRTLMYLTHRIGRPIEDPFVPCPPSQRVICKENFVVIVLLLFTIVLLFIPKQYTVSFSIVLNFLTRLARCISF